MGGSGTGDTGDTLLKQTRSSPPAAPLGQEHAFASGRTRGRPGRPPAGPAPPAREAATLPRVPSAAPSPPEPRPAAPAPRGPARAHLAARASRPVCRFLRRFRLWPRNPRERAGGSNPSPPIPVAAAAAAAAVGVQRARGSGRSRDRSNRVFARTERHNHAAFGGLREGGTKWCEPILSVWAVGCCDAQSLNSGRRFGARCASLFASVSVRVRRPSRSPLRPSGGAPGCPSVPRR